MNRAIDGERLRADLVAPAGPYARLDVLQRTGSTNADLRAAAPDGAADRTVLVAEEQTAGSGRRSRFWSSPKGGVYCSVLLRANQVPFARVGSLTVVAGLAVTDMAIELGVEAALKWPNDVLTGSNGGKCAGILAEAVPGDEVAVVVGIGLNVLDMGQQVTAGPGGVQPTSLAAHAVRHIERTEVVRSLLWALDKRERPWREAGGDLARAGLLDDYRARCATLGSHVQVAMPGQQTLVGRAVDVERAGQLQIETADGARTTVFAGDVVHLRGAR